LCHHLALKSGNLPLIGLRAALSALLALSDRSSVNQAYQAHHHPPRCNESSILPNGKRSASVTGA
jgi:hypothetical protein